MHQLPAELARRLKITGQKWDSLRTPMQALMPDTSDEWSRACIYVTGSMARGEASLHSDLDLFVLHEFGDPSGTPLTAVEYSHLISKLDQTREAAGFRSFSRGGAFLVPHSFSDMIATIGHPDDDARNLFTARMLLLINSHPLLNEGAYTKCREAVLDHYWRRAESPDMPFFPIYLTNDIRRWWGALCLNFEHFNPPSSSDPQKRAKRRVANLKLRYARLLAVYTPLLGLLATSTEGGVTRTQAHDVLDASPVGRLRSLLESTTEVSQRAHDLLERYAAYLIFMDKPESELLARVLERDWSTIKGYSYEFGNALYSLLESVGRDKPLYRYILV